jgi:hypothetical protein
MQGDIVLLPASAMATDNSKRGVTDSIYVAWADGRGNSQVDVIGSGSYNFSDILFAQSTDGGSTWSAPKAVSPTPDDFAGVGRDQIQPAIADEGHSPTAVPINDADFDYQLSRLGGFTQSETSSAWCGDTVVAGFNDSGAFVRSVVEGVGGSSFTGVGVSQNRGRSFTGLPFLNPGPDPATFLGGDPVVVCSDSRHFVYASLLSETISTRRVI